MHGMHMQINFFKQHGYKQYGVYKLGQILQADDLHLF